MRVTPVIGYAKVATCSLAPQGICVGVWQPSYGAGIATCAHATSLQPAALLSQIAWAAPTQKLRQSQIVLEPECTNVLLLDTPDPNP